MSENLDLVRSIYADWERGDFSRTEWADPKIEFEQRAGLAPLTVHGVAAMAEAWREFLRAWADISTKADKYRELDSERVLVFGHYSGHGKLSGLELEDMRTDVAALVHIRDGKVTRLVLYADSKRALADLGLEGEEMTECHEEGPPRWQSPGCHQRS
jgi:ketosteroid isomerase-like protein